MTENTQTSHAVYLLASINRLSLKAFNAKTKQALIFLILNDTLKVVQYKRAGLWKITKHQPELLGISGYSTFNAQTPYVKRWGQLVKNIKNIEISQIIPITENFTEDNKPFSLTNPPPNVLWLPIVTQSNFSLGLWLERHFNNPWKEDEIEILDYLMQNYSAAWDKFSRWNFGKINFRNPAIYIAAILLLTASFIHIPLPISAPCEIVAQSPILITAPLDGIVNEIKVEPGQTVKKGDILFAYDKRALLEELKVAKDQVQMVQAELKRANSLAFKDKKSLDLVGVNKEKLKKEEAELDLAMYRASELDVKSPINGIVMLDDADQWRGKPVHVGESVMTVSDPDKTKIKIWIPENDNVEINPKHTIKIILNTMPEKTFHAKLKYISKYTAINDKSSANFVAEAEWIQPNEDVLSGLKGTAILYGEDVPILYWILRRPWAYIRNVLGF
jgi:multidrug resistance efflux pump